MTLLTCVALIVGPIGGGALFGVAMRWLLGRRLRGIISALLCVLVPAAAVVAVVVLYPIVGLWDALVEGLLLGVGVLSSVHRALAAARDTALLASSVVLAMCLLEVASRLFLPPPPGFPMMQPHLLLADALKSDLSHQPWDTLCKELVCSIVYGDQYSGILDLAQAKHDVVTPQTFVPRAGAPRRVLHLGDSMAFGFGLARDQTFTAELERLEPGVQHINAAIPGTAPDAYLAVFKAWLAMHKIDVVVMHVYEGNDLDGLDSRYACCDWQSLLVYGDKGAALRCPQATAPDFGRAGWEWLRFHNPPPYLVRALIGTSVAAAHLAAASTLEPFFLEAQSTETRLEHLELIFKAARAAAEAKRIPLVVEVLPSRSWLETQATWQHYAPRIVEAAQRAGVPVLDGSELFRQRVVDGELLFAEHPADIHFGARGQAVMGQWMHERLSSVAAVAGLQH